MMSGLGVGWVSGKAMEETEGKTSRVIRARVRARVRARARARLRARARARARVSLPRGRRGS